MLGPVEVNGDLLDQPRVAGEAEEVVDAVFFDHFISDSLAKPLSARSMSFTRGQRSRICPTMRATSSTAPAEASMFERRSVAARRCRPQKT